MDTDAYDIAISLPTEFEQVFESPEEAAAFARRSLILELLRDARISQGKAAHLLGITRWDILDLMVKHQIPSGPATLEEVDQEFEAIERYLQEKPARARG